VLIGPLMIGPDSRNLRPGWALNGRCHCQESRERCAKLSYRPLWHALLPWQLTASLSREACEADGAVRLVDTARRKVRETPEGQRATEPELDLANGRAEQACPGES